VAVCMSLSLFDSATNGSWASKAGRFGDGVRVLLMPPLRGISSDTLPSSRSDPSNLLVAAICGETLRDVGAVGAGDGAVRRVSKWERSEETGLYNQKQPGSVISVRPQTRGGKLVALTIEVASVLSCLFSAMAVADGVSQSSLEAGSWQYAPALSNGHQALFVVPEGLLSNRVRILACGFSRLPARSRDRGGLQGASVTLYGLGVRKRRMPSCSHDRSGSYGEGGLTGTSGRPRWH